MLTKRAPKPVALLKTYRDVRRGRPPVVDEERSLIKSHLKLLGVVKREGKALQVRNRVYRQVFDRQWIKEHLPENLWQRIKPAMPIIAVLLAAFIGMAGVAGYAFQQRSVAQDALVIRQHQIAEQQTRETKKQAKIATKTQFANNQREELDEQRRNAGTQMERTQKHSIQLAEDQRQSATQKILVAKLRGKAAVVLDRLPTARAVDGMVMAIQAMGEVIWQKPEMAKQVLTPVQSSLLAAVQSVKEQNLITNVADVISVAFSPDGQTIASGSADNTVRLWDLQGQPIGQPFQGHTSWVTSVAFSPDGQTIASGSWDNTVRLWDLQGQPIGQPFQGHTNAVFSVAFSPDGKTIASGSLDNTLRLWDLQGQPIGQPFQGHTASVLSVAFSPDGKTIASGSSDNTVRLWDLQGQPIGQLFQGHTNAVISVAFSPDGQTIASGSWDKTVRLWKGNWQGWLQAACNHLRFHPVLQKPESSSEPLVAAAARQTYEEQVWGKLNFGSR